MSQEIELSDVMREIVFLQHKLNSMSDRLEYIERKTIDTNDKLDSHDLELRDFIEKQTDVNENAKDATSSIKEELTRTTSTVDTLRRFFYQKQSKKYPGTICPHLGTNVIKCSKTSCNNSWSDNCDDCFSYKCGKCIKRFCSSCSITLTNCSGCYYKYCSDHEMVTINGRKYCKPCVKKCECCLIENYKSHVDSKCHVCKTDICNSCRTSCQGCGSEQNLCKPNYYCHHVKRACKFCCPTFSDCIKCDRPKKLMVALQKSKFQKDIDVIHVSESC